MTSLTAAHRGYEYQDILAACRLVDMLLGSVLQAHVDEKFVDDDRFDDLSIVEIDGTRERTQFKHTENADRPLSLTSFTTDGRGLRLDRVFASIIADWSGPGRQATSFVYRLVLRDAPPIDQGLIEVLKPIEEDDPGPFIPGFSTRRFRFDAAALWAQRVSEQPVGTRQHFSFLFRNESSLTLSHLEWACQHLVVELGAPPASGDLTTPAAAELLILNRMRAEVGAESFPNLQRRAIDVAAAMISTARAARQGRLVVTVEELLRRAQLRSDFGAVSRAHPVDHEVEVLRTSTVRDIVEAVTELSATGGRLLVVGPPGQGKSWVCQQVLTALSGGGWLIAEHYCYLGDADGELNERVLSEAVFGSLLSRLAAADPSLVVQHRPRFAADEETLESCVRRSLAKEPHRKIALVIDGIDHITRVRARVGDRFDPSRSLAESLAALDIPAGCIVIVLSQPGSHLAPLEQAAAITVKVPGLSRGELELLTVRLNVFGSADDGSSTAPTLVERADRIEDFLDALEERTKGNALYATYLCRETLRRTDTSVDAAVTVRSMPEFDGTLKSYYDYLHQSLGLEAGWVADVVALVSFSVTRAELREIRPDAAHRVDSALALLAPVLVDRATQGGVRVYHESFARYLRGAFKSDPDSLKVLLERIAAWLEEKGLFKDPRGFRSLLPILAESGNHKRVVELVDRNFVTRAVAAGFPSSAIVANLATVVSSAAKLSDWSVIVRCVELARAADSYQGERFDSALVAFADVPAAILGANTLASRLVDEDRLVMPARAGLQMCAAVDRLGATAPWRLYMIGYLRETKDDNTSYDEMSNQAVSLSWLRGRLRLASDNQPASLAKFSDALEVEPESDRAETDKREPHWEVSAPIDWDRLAASVEAKNLPIRDVIAAITDIHGADGVIKLIRSLNHPGEACLAFAECLAVGEVSDGPHGASPRLWAIAAIAHGIPAGSIHRVLRLGVDPTYVARESNEAAHDRLVDLTLRVQESGVRFQNGDLASWLDACSLSGHLDYDGSRAAEVLIVGEGWYRCWLRFVLALSRAEAARAGQEDLAIQALRMLTEDLRPFVGDPRSCDLYSQHGAIQETISRAVSLLDAHWETGVRILKEVSDSISTSLFGELGGPVPPDFVLRLAVDGVTPERREVVQALIDEEIKHGSARRYYSDLAEYRLFAARLALATDSLEDAERLWREACGFLTAYGFHKDITIYELLDPLPSLISVDPARGRLRVAAVQPLCERIPWHTDLKETRGAWSRWWAVLAKADPVALIHLAVPAMLRKCNDTNWLLDGALDQVWKTWHDQVEPAFSGTLRLALARGLDKRDHIQIRRLADNEGLDREAVQRLMTWLLARADERPISYSYSNSDELLAKDENVLAELNAIATSVDLPSVSAVSENTQSIALSDTSSASHLAHGSTNSVIDAVAYSSLPSGLPGLVRAIRAWRRKPYDAGSAQWAMERFANAIGYRLVELAATGRQHEAASSLRSLADSVRLSESADILRAIAEGLERHGEVRLAAVAYTLSWTRARGHGGWLTFGGETNLDALERASELDAETASSVVAEEIERAVATSYGPWGISQAVVLALAASALRPSGTSPVDSAFAAWDEACAVIGARSPRVSDHDDPDRPYLPRQPDNGEVVIGDLTGAFALAILGLLFHPSRERKRRSFLGAQLLIEHRAETAAAAFDVALSNISDPETLAWLLSLLDSAREKSGPIVAACQSTLRDLASRELLTVRALARRLVGDDDLPLVPPAAPEPALLADGDPLILTSAGGTEYGPAENDSLDEFLNDVVGNRLTRGERLLPRLRTAVKRRVASRFQEEQFTQRLNSQLDDLASRVRKRWPDAFLAHEETIGATIQSVAAGGRAAMLETGRFVANAVTWEDKLASAILDEPSIPLTLEATRQPRPLIEAPPGNRSGTWARVRQRAVSSEPSDIDEACSADGLLTATLRVQPYTATGVMDRGKFRDWRWIATMEDRLVKASEWGEEKALLATRYRVIEVRDVGDRRAFALPPVSRGDLRMWKAEVDFPLTPSVFSQSQPIVGVDRDLDLVGDGRKGLGAPRAVLTPSNVLLGSLGLHPGDGCNYHDGDGIALALVTWRAEYETNEYELARPRLVGSGIVIRQDLLERLARTVGEHRLIVRDFVSGSEELAASVS